MIKYKVDACLDDDSFNTNVVGSRFILIIKNNPVNKIII